MRGVRSRIDPGRSPGSRLRGSSTSFVAPSSDREVLSTYLIEREYGCLDDRLKLRLVIDCGANVGYSSAYFLSRHPKAGVGDEPDRRTRDVEAHLAPGGRVNLIQAGVSSHATRLVLSENRYRDRREWTRQVRASEPAEKAAHRGRGHQDAAFWEDDSGRRGGAEVVIFSENCRSWLDKVDAIAIELHDNSVFGKGTEVFFTAIAGLGFQVWRSGELTICRKA